MMSDMNQNNQMANKLPINDLLINAFKMVWQERRDFTAMAALPILGLALVAAATHFYFPGDIVEYNEEGLPIRLNAGVFINSAVMMIFYVMFAVAWHRRCLMPDLSVTVGTALKWDAGKTAFLLRFIGIFGIILLALFPLSLIAGLLGSALEFVSVFIMMVSIFLILSRLVLVLPAAAIREPISYKQAWIITKGNSWRMILVYLVPSIPVSAVQILVLLFMAGVLKSLNGLETLTGIFILNLVQEFIAYIGVAVGVSALSSAYKFFRSKSA